MDPIGEDLSMQCRLCSSKSNIISVFKGKNKKIRNYIRKLVEIVTGVKYEVNDYYECICYTCIVHVYNMYVFHVKSTKNAERLETLIADKVHRRRKNNEIKKLDDIKLVDFDEIKNIVGNWVKNKIVQCPSESTISNPPSIQQTDSEPLIISSDAQVQTEITKYSVGIQTIICGTVSTIDKQTKPSTKDQYTQYEIENFTVRSVNYITQEKENDVSSRTVKPTVINKSVQCDRPKIVNNGMEKTVSSDLQLIRNGAAGDLQFATPNSARKSDGTDNETKPLVFDCSLLRYSPSNLFDKSISLKTSPRSLGHLSPVRSSFSLLETTDKVMDVFHCEECDFVMYNKAEVQQHKKIHMRCKLCQKRFRSIKRTKEHYENCKQIMDTNQPYIALERFEFSNEESSSPPQKKSKASVEVHRGPKKKK